MSAVKGVKRHIASLKTDKLRSSLREIYCRRSLVSSLSLLTEARQIERRIQFHSQGSTNLSSMLNNIPSQRTEQVKINSNPIDIQKVKGVDHVDSQKLIEKSY